MSEQPSTTGQAPRYAVIGKILRERILSDYYRESGFLPQERELAQEFQVSRNTMRSALQILSDDNLITKVQGRGTMVNQTVGEPGEYVVVNYGGGVFSSYIVTMLQEIDRQAGHHSGFMIYTQLQDAGAEELKKLHQRLSGQRHVRGLLLLGNYTRPIVRRLQEHFALPMVMIGDIWQEPERSPEPLISQVVGDDYAKMYQATRYLLQQGRRRIAAIGQPRGSIWGNAYYQGYLDAYADQNIPLAPEYYEGIDNSGPFREAFNQALTGYLERLFTCTPLPDALIFPAEYYGTIKWLTEQYHIAVPETLRLVGRRSVGNQPQEYPCVATNPEEVIREAFDLLRQERENRGRVKQRRIVAPTWMEAVSQSGRADRLPKP